MALTTIKSTGVDFTANTVTVGTLYRTNLPLVCNDISNYFNGLTTTFPLLVDQNYINTVTDSKDVQVVVNGQVLSPWIAQQTWPWTVEYTLYKGYRVVGANLTIYNAPDAGDQATVTVVSTSANAQVRKYPYSAATIALGD